MVLTSSPTKILCKSVKGFLGYDWTYKQTEFTITSSSIYKYLVRNTVAFSLAAIAHWDWPDHWPQLFDILIQVQSAFLGEGISIFINVILDCSQCPGVFDL